MAIYVLADNRKHFYFIGIRTFHLQFADCFLSGSGERKPAAANTSQYSRVIHQYDAVKRYCQRAEHPGSWIYQLDHWSCSLFSWGVPRPSGDSIECVGRCGGNPSAGRSVVNSKLLGGSKTGFQYSAKQDGGHCSRAYTAFVSLHRSGLNLLTVSKGSVSDEEIFDRL